MRVAINFKPEFLEGFVDQCQKLGMSCEETEIAFKKHANNMCIAQPNIYEGFKKVLGQYQGPLTKSALTRWFAPDVLALAEECRIKWGSDVLSQHMRVLMGLPEPSWDTVPEEIKKTASSVSGLMQQFDYLPLNQKVLLASLMGGGLGGAARSLAPTEEDQQEGRGLFNRVTRGVLRGGATGAGAALGAATGSGMAGDVSPDLKIPAMSLGGVVGGLAGKRLVNDIVS